MIFKRIEKYCKDYTKIENYEKAVSSNERWDCHHRLETHNSDGERRLIELSKKELIALDMYYNQPAEALVFLTHKEHASLHWKDISKSEQQKQKISVALKGKLFSEEHKKHLAIAFSSGKTQSRGSKWYNNGIISKRLYEDHPIPEGFKLGRLSMTWLPKREKK